MQGVFRASRIVSIDEWMVVSKAWIGLKQYIKEKPTKWGYKLFVICDWKTGYTCDFNIYMPVKRKHNRTRGSHTTLSWDWQAHVWDEATSYSNIISTPAKFCFVTFFKGKQVHVRLFVKIVEAVLSLRLTELPRITLKEQLNGLERKKFVKWKDTRELSMLWTTHRACGSDTVSRKNKKPWTGEFERIEVPIPVLRITISRWKVLICRTN